MAWASVLPEVNILNPVRKGQQRWMRLRLPQHLA